MLAREVIYIGDDETVSQRLASAHLENLGTPLNSMKIIRKHRVELTPGTEQIYGQALLALVKPGSSPNFMEVPDAKASLKYVADKVVTRAAKRTLVGFVRQWPISPPPLRSSSLERGEWYGDHEGRVHVRQVSRRLRRVPIPLSTDGYKDALRGGGRRHGQRMGQVRISRAPP